MFEWESQFEPHILNRGSNYAKSGAVKHLRRKGDEVEAVVSGSEYYKVSMTYDGHHASELYCSCPYAADGSLCKHMAAVLYEVDKDKEDAERDESFLSGSEKSEISSKEAGLRKIAEIIREADRSKLKEILLELANRDEKVEAHIRSVLSGTGRPIDISEMKKEVDNIIDSYTERGGYIDFRNATDFEDDFVSYLNGSTDSLMNEGCYSDAFELSSASGNTSSILVHNTRAL